MSRECMESVRQFKVDKGSVALWWLGRWVSDQDTGRRRVLRRRLFNRLLPEDRRVYGPEYGPPAPVFIEPEELEVDHFLCTHSHYDHADPETITRLRKQAIETFVGPGLACETFCNCGRGNAKIHQVYPGAKRQVL